MTKILFLSDLHCGSLLGLTPPFYMTEKTKEVSQPLWDGFISIIREVGPVDILVINGDAVNGEGKKETIGHITTDTKEQAEIAAECISCVKAKDIFMTYGTPFHTVGSYSYEEIVAEKVAAEIKDTLLLDVHGVKMNIRHVSGRSDIPYGQGTPLLKEMIRDLVRSMQEEREPADWTIRGHIHYWIKVEMVGRLAAQLPCLQIPQSVFSRKLRTMYYTLGAAIGKIPPNGRSTLELLDISLKFVYNKEYIKWDRNGK